MSKRINLAYFSVFNKMYLSKDTFLIPYYMAKNQNVPLRVIYGSNIGDVELPKVYRGVVFGGHPRKCVRRRDEIVDWVQYILPKARSINSLFFCGCSAHHMMLTWVLLQINPKIVIVVFGDMEEPQAKDIFETGLIYRNGIVGRIKRALTQFYFNHVKFSVANESAYGIMEDTYRKNGWSGLLPLYPCLDDELFYNMGLRFRSWKEKENIMISVGRIGNHQKNTDMLLDALSMVNLKDWKVYLIGPITENFEVGRPSKYKQKIDDFFVKNPHLNGKVIFTGMIYDQKVLFDYYLRAKVYLSSARHEGFANVYSQAAACGCYIISTDVGGAKTASNNWKFGMKIKQEDAEGLAEAMQKVINDVKSVDLSLQPEKNKFLYSKCINNIFN